MFAVAWAQEWVAIIACNSMKINRGTGKYMEKTTGYLGQYHSEQISCYPRSDRSPSRFIFLSYHDPNFVGPLPKIISLRIFVV